MASRIHDQWAMVRRQRPKRIWNALKLWSSYHISRWSGKPRMWGLPMSLSIEPTTACNLGCPECPSGLKQFSRPTGNLKPEFFASILEQIRSHVSYLTFYFQGEPYIHPQFLELIRKAHEASIYTATSTNAHFLHPENARRTVASGLDRIIISLDGTTQEVYEQYRVHGNMDKVIEGTRNLVAAKRELRSRSPHVILQFLVVRPNEHQVEDVFRLGAELGVDEVRLKTAQVYDYANGNPLIPLNEKYARYRQKADGTWAIKNPLLNQCWRMWHGAVITWDGGMVPCCFDKDADHRLGDLSTDALRDIWHGSKYRAFRSQILKGRSTIDICTNCTEGTRVWEQA